MKRKIYEREISQIKAIANKLPKKINGKMPKIYGLKLAYVKRIRKCILSACKLLKKVD